MKMRADGVSFPRSPPGPAHGACASGARYTARLHRRRVYVCPIKGSGLARAELAVIFSPIVQVIIS